ncbi:hypothetical protein SGL43_01063 [Streptomyces globisporus]|uniref:Uncharacterized protein n=1 Tax=Streptomyces globisporus TaxID=1908 RepID=A0ABM9GS94_STRGL|nr:hypothetical protein SGL43_01063 [Streptomyces globisporus]
MPTLYRRPGPAPGNLHPAARPPSHAGRAGMWGSSQPCAPVLRASAGTRPLRPAPAAGDGPRT